MKGESLALFSVHVIVDIQRLSISTVIYPAIVYLICDQFRLTTLADCFLRSDIGYDAGRGDIRESDRLR
jgi:hypothetical protein